jgi:hypothetical protein
MSDWVKDRARSLQTYHGGTLVHIADVIAFGQECIERGKAEQDKAVAAERKRADSLQTKLDGVTALWQECQEARDAVGFLGSVPDCIKYFAAAEREGCDDTWAFRHGKAYILAQLENPDEALQDAVHSWVIKHYGYNWREGATAVCRALARTLEGKENSDAE